MRDVSVSFAATAIIQAANIATGLLAARLLLPEGRGELAEIMLWAGLMVEFGILGLSDALLYRIATAQTDPRRLFAAMATLSGILAVVMIGAGFIVEPFALSNNSPRLLFIALAFLTFYVPVQLGALFVATIFQGHLELITWNILRGLVAFAYLVFIGVAWLMGHATVEGFAIANVAGTVVSFALGLFLIARRGWIAWKPDWPTMRGLLIYGSKVHAGEMVNSARQRIDQALVALFLPASDLGIYVVALTVANGPQIMAQTLANLAFPKVTQQTETAGKIVVFGRYLRFTALTSVAAVVALLVVNHWVIPQLFGQPFAAAVLIANIMLLGSPFAAMKLMFIQALKAWDRSLLIGRAELVGLIAAAAALTFLLPRYGAAGAAWSLVVANVVAAAVMALSLRRNLRLSMSRLLTPTREDWRLVGDIWRKLRR